MSTLVKERPPSVYCSSVVPEEHTSPVIGTTISRILYDKQINTESAFDMQVYSSPLDWIANFGGTNA